MENHLGVLGLRYIAMLYTHSIRNQPCNTMVVFKMRDSVPSARYSSVCVNGESGSSLLIESTDSMIYEESFLCLKS